MLEHLKGETVFVLGGAGRMGRAIAAEVTAWGANAVIAGRDMARLLEAAAEIDQCRTAKVDASDPVDLHRVLSEIGPIQHVVVAVGNSGGGGSLGETDVTTAKAAFGRFWANYAAIHVGSGFLPPGGSIVLVSGSSARIPLAGFGLWTTLHAAIEGLAKGASYDLAPIRVNVVSPGGIDIRPDRQLLHRQGTVGDIGIAVAAMLANKAMTGAVVDVDSGERRGSWPTVGR